MAEFQPPQKKGSPVYFLIGLLIFISIIGVVVFVFYSDIEGFFNKEEPEANPFVSYDILIQDDLSNNEIPARYEIYQEGSVLRQQGITKAGILEKFTNALNSTNYSIAAYDLDKYYINTTQCDFPTRTCNIRVKPIANPIFFKAIKYSETEYRITIKPENGTLFNVILCAKWDYTVKKIIIKNINVTAIPSQFLTEFDQCNLITEGYLQELKDYDVEVMMDEKEFSTTGISKFTLAILDTCLANKENIFQGCAPNNYLDFEFVSS